MTDIQSLLQRLRLGPELPSASTGLKNQTCNTPLHQDYSPVDGKLITKFRYADKAAYEQSLACAQEAYLEWRTWPAPKRGEVVRQIGDALRQSKQDLGTLVSYEMGKSLQEGLGEVQEMIDICDFAVGLSRQLYGLTMHSERPEHRMYEQWHPLGVVGIISAFNFPVAVWSWNAMIAAVCGNACLWKPSEKTPATAMAIQHILADVLRRNQLPEGFKQVFNLNVIEGLSHREIGEVLNITESTSRSQLVRARNFLKKLLLKRDKIRV